jgi:hypothetical protein
MFSIINIMGSVINVLNLVFVERMELNIVMVLTSNQ